MPRKRTTPASAEVDHQNIKAAQPIGSEVEDSAPPQCPDCSRAPGHDDGCPTGAAMEAMLDADREWFAAHPLAAEYRRNLLPGDLGLTSLDCVQVSGRVLVRRVADGVRVRLLPSVALLPDGDGLSESAHYSLALVQGAPVMPAPMLRRLLAEEATS